MSTMFVREDWALFRTVDGLCQKAGVTPKRLRRLVAKELVDNALDVSSDCEVGMLPDETGFYVQDGGPGIDGTPGDIARLFSIRRPLTSSKLIRLPQRGAMGNGLRVVVGAVLASGGTLQLWTRGRHYKLFPQDSGETKVEFEDCDWPTGTRIEVTLGGAINWDQNCLRWAQLALRFANTDPIYKGLTSAYFFDSDSFFELLQAAGDNTVRDVIEQFDGCSGRKASIVTRAFLGRKAASLTRDEAEKLLKAARKHSGGSVNPKRLRCVGPISGAPEFHTKALGELELGQGLGDIQSILPFTVEAWAEHIQDSDKDSVQVFVNRTPICADISIERAKEKAEVIIYGCELGYRFKVGKKPIRVWINVQTPHMPITTDGKAPNLEYYVEEIRETVEKAARKAQRSNPSSRSQAQIDYVFEHLPAAMDAATHGQQYRVSQRRLFYRIRPGLIELLNKQPNFDTFTDILTKYENKFGDIPLLTRDPRGTLYHPHLREEIPIGTLSVENYERPLWTFSKILYSEKEGFFETLKDAYWPERHDCALLTSKGSATRAVRDLIDMLGDTDEEILFFAIHDADAYGTTIYNALQNATLARPARRVKVINLGLEPWEALAMGLPVESAETTSEKRKPVASYVPQEWSDWLQVNRVELDAMSVPQLLEWLDRKMEEHGKGKLIPPKEVLRDHVAEETRAILRKQLVADAIRNAGVDERVEAAMTDLVLPRIGAMDGSLHRRVQNDLSEDPKRAWREPVKHIATDLAKEAITEGQR